MKASDAVARFLLRHEISHCFELVGGMITHLLDSMAETGAFSIVSMHHEQAAAFAAEGVARQAAGRHMAVAMGTSGPGATNLLTGVGSCWFDSVPCLFITGQVNTHELKGDRTIRQQGFQEMEIASVVQSFTKFAVRVDDPEQLLPILHQAISIALSGRKGPVLVDIPNNIQRADLPEAHVAEWLARPLALEAPVPLGAEALTALVSLCREAQRPLVCLGGGARWSPEMAGWLNGLERHGVPYVSTLMGHERVPAGDHYLNMIGSYGNREANRAIQSCDLLIVVGARLDVRQTGADVNDFARSARVVQVDIDAGQLNNRVQADLSIRAGADAFFQDLAVTPQLFPNLDREWVRSLQQARARFSADEYPDWTFSPGRFFDRLNRFMAGLPVTYVCDVGNHQMWAAQSLRLGPRQVVHYSGGMGAMGFALPVAVGAAIYGRQKTIVLTGDGSLQINIQELDTIRRLGLDIVIIVFNNFSLGMVKNFQDLYFNGRDQSTRKGYSSPAFDRIAQAYDIPAVVLKDEADLDTVLDRVRSVPGPMLVEIRMEQGTECRPRLSFGDKLDMQSPHLE